MPTVTVDYRSDELAVDVDNDGRPLNAGPSSGGSGITGMRDSAPARLAATYRCAGTRAGGSACMSLSRCPTKPAVAQDDSSLVADDQALVRAGFVALLDAQDGIEVIAEADTGTRAVDAAR